MKLDARRAFIVSMLQDGIITHQENLLPETHRKVQSDTREYAMWMQKGMKWKDIEKNL
jgi:hypothetical protein